MLGYVSKLLALSTCLLLGISIGTCIIIEYEKATFKAYEWSEPPMIANCYGGDFNELYLKDAVEYWEKHGHEIAFIEQNPPDIICNEESMDGWIILKKKRKDGLTLAYTKRKVVLGKIRASTIYFNPGSYRLEHVIEHELGHAFGYHHIEIEGHVMHPDQFHMGPNFWIPDL